MLVIFQKIIYNTLKDVLKQPLKILTFRCPECFSQVCDLQELVQCCETQTSDQVLDVACFFAQLGHFLAGCAAK